MTDAKLGTIHVFVAAESPWTSTPRLILEDSGRLKEAIQAHQKALELNPEYSEAQEKLVALLADQ